ncbi:hypothetical protein [Pseudomonas sp. Z18(2022)]|uniref:hypothetical protein n=1 Tax=Pseudomonas sp. Z18(2022) TaxID=2983410 RepID=UPI002E80B576|nr:hypothetical protein [Pseudomonas sp. Z18(2022)]
MPSLQVTPRATSTDHRPWLIDTPLRSHAPASGTVVTDSPTASLPQTAANHLAWTLGPASPVSSRAASAEVALGKALGAAMQSGNLRVGVPEGSRLSQALDVYHEVLNQPSLVEWFARKGIEPGSVEVHRDFIAATVVSGGTRTRVKYTTADDSGWWQVSARLRVIREVLDPADSGLNYRPGSPPRVSRNTVLQFYGIELPASSDALNSLKHQLSQQGLPLVTQPQAQRMQQALEGARQTIDELDERQYLAERLTELVQDRPDGERVDLSEHPTELPPGSTLAISDEAARDQLNQLVASPAMQALLTREAADWEGNPFRISEGRLERRTPLGSWRNLTVYVEAVPQLKAELGPLVALSATMGNALYSVPQHDLRQRVAAKGLGSPVNAGQIRNVIRWLQTSLPPAPPLGDYDGWLTPPRSKGGLSTEDKTILANLAVDGSDIWSGHLDDETPASLRDKAGEVLEAVLNNSRTLEWGGQLAEAVEWLDASTDAGEARRTRQHLVIAALKLQVDPDAPGIPGQVAGYALYQPGNKGRTLSAVREDVEQHLIGKGIELKVAPLLAQLFLAQAAPEFLVRGVPDAVRIGTPAWMELRLGCKLADFSQPGTSRLMSEEQVTHLTTQGPTDAAQEALIQLHAMKILADWGVLNGVITAGTDGSHSEKNIQAASKSFLAQRAEANEAFTIATTALPTRRALAIKELLRAFPGVSERQLERMKVRVADDRVARNMAPSEPRTRLIIDTYMTGDLKPGVWLLDADVPPSASRKVPISAVNAHKVPEAVKAAQQTLDARISQLPALAPLLKPQVTAHYQKLQAAYATRLKLMFAELPLKDRQRIEKGTVQLYTLRGETGEPKSGEKPERLEEVRGRQGTLIRAEDVEGVSYFEVFASGKIVKRSDLPDTLPLNGTISADHETMLRVQRGTHVPFDYDAYDKGTENRAGAISSNVIIEPLGDSLPGDWLREGVTPDAFVPDTYASAKTRRIVEQIATDNFYERPATMLERARNPLPLENHREAVARDHAILVGLVPFVGAYKAFSEGKIGEGFANLVLDAGGLLMGAGSQARALIRSSRALKPVSALRGSLARIKPVSGPHPVKVAWQSPPLTFSDRAFNFARDAGLFASAVFNPVDGYPEMLVAATRGLAKLPLLIGGSALKFSKAAPHLVTAQEKLKSYLITAAGMQARANWAHRSVASVEGQSGKNLQEELVAGQHDGKWYAVDLQTGSLSGTPLRHFMPKPQTPA